MESFILAGKADWLNTIRLDDKKTAALMKAYRGTKRTAPSSKEGAKKKYAKFSCIQFSEIMQAVTETEYQGQGQMMWERQALEHWTSTAGGRMSEEEAAAKWKSLASKLEGPDKVVHDYKGPAKSPLRTLFFLCSSLHVHDIMSVFAPYKLSLRNLR